MITIIIRRKNDMTFEFMELTSDNELDFVSRTRRAGELEALISEANLRMYMGRTEHVCA